MIDSDNGSIRVPRPFYKLARFYFGLSGLSLGLATLLLMKLAATSPALVSAIYSRGVYPAIYRLLSFVPSLVPIPVIETLIILILVFLIFLVVRTIIRVRHPARRKRKARWWMHLFWAIFYLVSTAGFIFAWFGLGWGLNYYRLSWADSVGWSVGVVTAADMERCLDYLATSVTQDRRRLRLEKNGSALPLGGAWSDRSFLDRIMADYQKTAQEYPILRGDPVPPKIALSSAILSRFGISGITVPFTGEPLVNAEPDDWSLPFTAAHESAHSRGWAREDEANFLAYLTLESSEEPAFRYSAHLSGMLLLGHAMAAASPDLARFTAIEFGKLDKGVRLDLSNTSKWWKTHRGILTDVGSSVNDAYLKSQGQREGIKSYGRMVDLLMTWFLKTERGPINL